MDILFRRIGELVQGLVYLDRVRHMHISSCGTDSGIPESIELLMFVLRQLHFLPSNPETFVLALQEREGLLQRQVHCLCLGRGKGRKKPQQGNAEVSKVINHKCV